MGVGGFPTQAQLTNFEGGHGEVVGLSILVTFFIVLNRNFVTKF